MELFFLILIGLLMAINIISNVEFDNAYFSAATVILLAIIALGFMFTYFNKEAVVIKKSSDSDWELCRDCKHIKSDTTITRIVVFNKTDTVYPTTEYKVLK